MATVDSPSPAKSHQNSLSTSPEKETAEEEERVEADGTVNRETNGTEGHEAPSPFPSLSLPPPCSSASPSALLHLHSSPPPPLPPTSSSSSSSSSFAHFSAANLFGLFERITSGANFDANFCNGDILPKATDEVAPMDEFKPLAGTIPNISQQQMPTIDKLLQISQQFLNNNNEKMGHTMPNRGEQRKMNGGGTTGRAEGAREEEKNGNGTTNGGRSTGGGGDSRKRSYPYTFQFCVLCQKNVHSSKLPCHIRQCHVGKPMFQCPVCDFTSTYSKNNVKSHMVSLHGLAGDPISYMDQYASQVEEFMKQCFPNVRGRGRPLHGRLSPKQQNQLASPARSTVSTVCASDLSCGSASSSSVLLTPPQRRHSSAIARGGGGAKQQQRTTTAIGQRANNAVASAERSASVNVSGGGGSATFAAATASHDLYGSGMGMLTGHGRAAKDPSGLLDNKGVAPILQSNGFSPSSFNPFIYLQQINNLLSPTSVSSQFPIDVMMALNGGVAKNSDTFLPKVDIQDMDKSATTNSTQFSLEECLSLSQKILKEMNKDQAEPGTSGAIEQTAKDPLICHSSSSTASPPSSTCQFPVTIGNNSNPMADLQEQEPRFFPQQLYLSVLDGPSLEKTVFKTFLNSNELIEKFDLSIFESLLELNSRSLLTATQRQNVASVRKQLGLKSFEIMFAVHRLDIEVLRPENVHLVARIAPSELDIRRFQLFEQSNPSLRSLDDNEQFVIQLSKIDRLRHKLAVMALMGEFDDRLALLNQQLLHCSLAANLLHNSADFHTLLHLLLICANLINGDFSAQLIKGFRPHRLAEVCCAFRFPGGSTLLEVLGQVVRLHFADELDAFADQCKIVEEAAKVEFAQIQRELRSLEQGQKMVEEELQFCDDKNHQLANFLTHFELECAQLKETLQSTRAQIVATMEFFGDHPLGLSGDDDGCSAQHQCRPEHFFSGIAQFVRDLRTAVDSVGDQ